MKSPHYFLQSPLVLILSLCGSCHLLPDIPDPLNIPAAKAHNLGELHMEDGSYSYNATLLGDFRYLLESLTGADDTSIFAKATVQNPSMATMENLVDLMAANPDQAGAGDLQVQWCARLCSSDPSVIVRERAAQGLGDLGDWAGIRSITPITQGAVFASPEEIRTVLEAVLRGLRLMREMGEDDAALIKACADARALHLSVEGAWRLLSATGPLSDQAPGSSSRDAILALAQHLRVRLIEGGLLNALGDSSDVVRAAGLRAMVQIIGPQAMTGLLSRPMPGWGDTIILGLVDLVAQHGLPEDDASSAARDLCLESLVTWAVQHPSKRIRVRSMLALQRSVPDGPRSLREEDWHRWSLGAGSELGLSS